MDWRSEKNRQIQLFLSPQEKDKKANSDGSKNERRREKERLQVAKYPAEKQKEKESLQKEAAKLKMVLEYFKAYAPEHWLAQQETRECSIVLWDVMVMPLSRLLLVCRLFTQNGLNSLLVCYGMRTYLQI